MACSTPMRVALARTLKKDGAGLPAQPADHRQSRISDLATKRTGCQLLMT